MKPWVDIFFKAVQTGILGYAVFSGKVDCIQLVRREAPSETSFAGRGARPEAIHALPGFGGLPNSPMWGLPGYQGGPQTIAPSTPVKSKALDPSESRLVP